MTTLFYEGGLLFMSLLSICLLSVIILTLWYGRQVLKKEITGDLRHRLTYIRSAGLLALVLGILGQLIGLYEAFSQIQKVGGVSQEMLAGGLRVSMITTLYGMIIFVISYLIWWVLDARFR